MTLSFSVAVISLLSRLFYLCSLLIAEHHVEAAIGGSGKRRLLLLLSSSNFSCCGTSNDGAGDDAFVQAEVRHSFMWRMLEAVAAAGHFAYPASMFMFSHIWGNHGIYTLPRPTRHQEAVVGLFRYYIQKQTRMP